MFDPIPARIDAVPDTSPHTPRPTHLARHTSPPDDDSTEKAADAMNTLTTDPTEISRRAGVTRGAPVRRPPTGRTVTIRTTPRHASGSAPGTSVDAHRAGRRPTSRVRSEATYRRRRAAVGLLLAIVVAVVAVAVHDVLLDPVGAPAFAASDAGHAVSVRVTARAGDTLWSIAEQHRGAVPIRRYVDALIALNGGPSIQAGQSVLLP